MKIASDVTDQVVYFVALNSSSVRLTGLTVDPSSFTVYRARNGATAVVMTTPTVAEVDATNLPGVYTLLLDEDMTIGSGNFTEEMLFHISNAAGGMVSVDRTIELFQPNQTRVNQPAGQAYSLKISSTVDGTYKATPPIRLRPGAVDVAVSVGMSPQFGDDFVSTVATPIVSGGSVTAIALGPRDTEAMVQLGGTATAQEQRTVEFLVTMDNGDAVLVTFDVIVFAD